MTTRPSRGTFLTVVCLALVLSAGCLADDGEGAPDGETVAEGLQSIDAISATASLEIEVGNETTTMEMDVLQRLGTGEFRATVTEGEGGQAYRLISNGTQTWMYNRSGATATRLELGGVGEANWSRTVEHVSGMFDSLSSTEDEDVSISPLPVVPGGDGGTGVGSAGLASMPAMGNVTVTYDGTASVAGEETHVVEVGPADDGTILRNGTLWFEADRYYPIKAEYGMSVGGRSADVGITYGNLTYDPSIPDGAFTFDPPANVTVENVTDAIETYGSREELAAATDTSVPDPDLPDSYGFSQGSINDADGSTVVSLQYANATGSLVVNKRPATGNLTDAGESVDVAGREGRVVELGEATAVVWECGDHRYTLSGSLSSDHLRTIAESMVCG